MGCTPLEDAAARYESGSFSLERPLDVDMLARELAGSDCGVIRAKGVLQDCDGSIKTLHVVGAQLGGHARSPGLAVPADGIGVHRPAWTDRSRTGGACSWGCDTPRSGRSLVPQVKAHRRTPGASSGSPRAPGEIELDVGELRRAGRRHLGADAEKARANAPLTASPRLPFEAIRRKRVAMSLAQRLGSAGACPSSGRGIACTRDSSARGAPVERAPRSNAARAGPSIDTATGRPRDWYAT